VSRDRLAAHCCINYQTLEFNLKGLMELR
jgi:hypothetical protein